MDERLKFVARRLDGERGAPQGKLDTRYSIDIKMSVFKGLKIGIAVS